MVVVESKVARDWPEFGISLKEGLNELPVAPTAWLKAIGPLMPLEDKDTGEEVSPGLIKVMIDEEPTKPKGKRREPAE
jgi:hypothetical protein